MNPGSPKAIANGCTCAVPEQGRRVWDKRDGYCYWLNDNCPLHGIRDAYEQTDATSGPMDLEGL